MEALAGGRGGVIYILLFIAVQELVFGIKRFTVAVVRSDGSVDQQGN